MESEPTEVINPNTIEGGTSSIRDHSFSEDGNLIAYGLTEKGSDWIDIHFHDVRENFEHPREVLSRVKFSKIAWKNNQGIFYSVSHLS